jgi:positive regulator of sigma E activity
MKEIGNIISIKGNKGIVRLSPNGGCKNCGMNQFCHSTGSGDRELEVQLEGKNYQIGDWVQVMTTGGGRTTAAALIFIFPLIISIAGYALIYSIVKSQIAGMAGFAGFLILSGLILAWIDKRFGKREFFKPHIIRKMKGSFG